LQYLDFERPLVELEEQIAELRKLGAEGADLSIEIDKLERRAQKLQREIFHELTPWQKVQLCRHPARPYTLDYVERLFPDFLELHGDRSFADDAAIVGGLATFDGRSVLVVGHQKGRTTKENLHRNFAMPHPEGYRKARRLMEMAARFGLPILTFVDTPGAYPGLGAEERGQATAIAESLESMAKLPVPVVTTIIGEGGSGGALALAVANRVLMLEHATYSVISPEGCASILWKDQTEVETAATQLKLTAQDLHRFGIVDAIVEEPAGGAHRDVDAAAKAVGEAHRGYLEVVTAMSPEALRRDRYERFRRMGEFDTEERKKR
jgi:acetyl-CoA carboxylase carboxyl transferase subunit alpha